MMSRRTDTLKRISLVPVGSAAPPSEYKQPLRGIHGDDPFTGPVGYRALGVTGQLRNGRRSGRTTPAGGRGSDGSDRTGAGGGGRREPVFCDVVGDVDAEPDSADVLCEVDLVVLVDSESVEYPVHTEEDPAAAVLLDHLP